MKKVIFATGNQGKMKEIREILGDLDIELLSLKDAGIHADIVEDGKTFEENEEYYWLKTKKSGEDSLQTYTGAFLEYMKKEKEYTGKVGELAESVREALKNNELIKWDNNNISWSRWKYGEKNSYIMLNKEKFDKFVAKENQ